MDKKIKKKLPKHWKLHFAWVVAFTMMMACGALLYSYRELTRLRSELRESEQTLQECLHQQGIWESQISPGEIKILKRDGDTQIVERWELTKEEATDTWIIK